MSLLGQQIGHYKLVAKVGEGGMGTVYLAEHALIGRRAAIKVLLREMSHNEEHVARFFQEARAATSVKHPGIVEIYDFGYHTGGSAYIVMEYLDGEGLGARIRRLKTLSEAQAARLTRQVASALEAAHQKGIVHRDLKPDNIYIVGDPDVADGERAKVLDFGIAKLATDLGPGAVKTRTGAVIGTPQYMAPEQCKGAGHVDHRADLYALGCILFEMVCGRPPFMAEGTGEILAQQIFAELPRPSTVAPVSPELEAVLLKLLAKTPDQRYQSARELVEALHRAVPASGHYSPVVSWQAPSGPVSGRAGSVSPEDAATVIQVPPPPARPPTPAPALAPTTPAPAVAPLLAHEKGPKTTMGTASGAIDSQPAPRRSWVGVAIGIALVAAIAVTFQLVRDDGDAGDGGPVSQPAPAPAPVPVTPAIVTPPATPAVAPSPSPPAPVEAPKPAKVTLRVTTTPPGADVYRLPQAVRVGKTPLALETERVDGEAVFVVRKAGFKDVTVAMPANADGAREVALEKKSAGRVARPPATGGKPPPPPASGSGAKKDGSTLDPFEKLGGK